MMTPKQERQVAEIERRIERRAHWYRVRVVFSLLAAGLCSLIGLVYLVAWAASRFAL